MSATFLKTAKIVGSPGKKTWAQTHIFLPDEKDKKHEFGSLLATLVLKTRQEKLDINLYGKEIISRLHEIYYSSEEKKPLKRLRQSCRSLIKEFSDLVDLEIGAAVFVSRADGRSIGYFAAAGSSQAFILRQGRLAKILMPSEKTVQSASGFLQSGDVVILASQQLFNIVSAGALKAALENQDIDETAESLSTLIHGHEKNSRTAGIIFKTSFLKTKKSRPIKINWQAQAGRTSLALKTIFKNLKNLEPKKLLEKKTILEGIKVKDEQKRLKSKKTTLSAAVILIALLAVSIVLGIRKRAASKDFKTAKNLFDEANSRYEQAVSLEELNPLRARVLLVEAKDSVDQGIEAIENKSEAKKINELLDKISLELEKVAREYKTDEAEIFLDLSLAKDDFKASHWAKAEDSLFIFDNSKGTILEIGVDNKSFEVVGGGEKLLKGEFLAAVEAKVFVLVKDRIYVVDVKRAEIVDEVEADDWGQINDLTGFSGNAYLLDSQSLQIWKYQASNGGLGIKRSYLENEEESLKTGISMAIDGSVWILTSEGEVLKFTRGVRDHFVLTGLDKPFAQAFKLYTNESLDNLYIVDRKNTRVVVIAKETGEYQAQYVWPGIAGVADIVVLEDKGKILLLAGERIYEIEIRD